MDIRIYDWVRCIYPPQEHTFISTVWLWSTDEYVFISILSESPSLTYDCILFTIFELEVSIEELMERE